MTCCSWETFEESFISAWDRDRFKPSRLLIDWRLARRAWSRYHATGGEAAFPQLRALRQEADYLWVAYARRSDDDEGGLPRSEEPVKPAPIPA